MPAARKVGKIMAKIRIGRSSSNEFVLTDTTVSRSHAEVEDIGGGLYRLTDVGSSAGTFLKQGGKWSQVTSAEIGADALLRFGEAEVRLSDIVNFDPATVAPAAAGGGLGQRAERGAADLSRLAEGASGGGGAGASGGGWSSLTPNYKIGIIVGGGVFGLLIVVALVLSLTGGGGGRITGGEGGATAGGGAPPGGGAPAARTSGNAAKAKLQQVMMASCTKRGQNRAMCRCVTKNIVAGISNADAEAIVNAKRGGGKPPSGPMRKFLASALAAARTCAKRQG